MIDNNHHHVAYLSNIWIVSQSGLFLTVVYNKALKFVCCVHRIKIIYSWNFRGKEWCTLLKPAAIFIPKELQLGQEKIRAKHTVVLNRSPWLENLTAETYLPGEKQGDVLRALAGNQRWGCWECSAGMGHKPPLALHCYFGPWFKHRFRKGYRYGLTSLF